MNGFKMRQINASILFLPFFRYKYAKMAIHFAISVIQFLEPLLIIRLGEMSQNIPQFFK